MPDKNEAQNQGIPIPDPALKRLNRLVGTWCMRGRTLGSDKDTITGTTTFKWLPGGFFLQQGMEMDYEGKLIGYDPKTKAFSSYVYSNMAADPWPYEWDIQGDTCTISIKHGPMILTDHA